MDGENLMRIQLSELRRAADSLFDHLERTGRTEIEVTEVRIIGLKLVS